MVTVCNCRIDIGPKAYKTITLSLVWIASLTKVLLLKIICVQKLFEGTTTASIILLVASANKVTFFPKYQENLFAFFEISC